MFPKAVDSKYACKNPTWILQAVSLDGKFTYKKMVTDISIQESKGDGYVTYKVKRKLKRVPITCVRAIIPCRCGKCEGCRKLQNDQWFARLYHHGKERNRVGFLTLTFNEKTLASIKERKEREEIAEEDNRCVYNWYVQPFIKRLRKRGYSFDYFCVSEKGTEKERFHFHIIFFFDLVGDLCNKQTGVLLPEKSALYKSAIDTEVALSLRWQRDCRHLVKLPKGKIDPYTGTNYRWQTNREMAFQLVAEHEWSSYRNYGHSLGISGIEPIVERVWSKKYNKEVKVTTTKDAYGIVTYFESSDAGMLHYVTSYMTKCQHDGVETYHRQSQGIGYSFGIDPKYHDDLVNGRLFFIPCGQSKDASAFQFSVPIPRYYRKKFEMPEVSARRFWDWYEKYRLYLELSDELNTFVENRYNSYGLAKETLSFSDVENAFGERYREDGFYDGLGSRSEFTDIGTDWLTGQIVLDGFPTGEPELFD